MIAVAVALFAFDASALAASKCAEATADGKFWQYRNFLITGGKKGLAKGNNNVNGDGVEAALNALLRRSAAWDTMQHVEMIEALRARLDGFDGAPGLVGEVWLKIARKAMDHYGTDELEKSHKIDIDVWGRIDDNDVTPHAGEDGFSYDASDGSGHIWATMCFEVRWGTPSNQDPDFKLRYALKTQIAPCGFKVIDRGSGQGNKPIFVGSYMKFFANNNDLKDAKTKLEAVNLQAGDTAGKTCPPEPADGYVTLAAAFLDPGNGSWTDMNDGSHGYLFNSNPQACVDMFFETTTVPTGLSDGDDRPNYCLGRCADPPIVNSGM